MVMKLNKSIREICLLFFGKHYGEKSILKNKQKRDLQQTSLVTDFFLQNKRKKFCDNSNNRFPYFLTLDIKNRSHYCIQITFIYSILTIVAVVDTVKLTYTTILITQYIILSWY